MFGLRVSGDVCPLHVLILRLPCKVGMVYVAIMSHLQDKEAPVPIKNVKGSPSYETIST